MNYPAESRMELNPERGLKEVLGMQMDEVRVKAKALNLKTARMKKADIIREIQVAEGNFPCFETALDYCDQMDCCFRDDCLPNAE